MHDVSVCGESIAESRVSAPLQTRVQQISQLAVVQK